MPRRRQALHSCEPLAFHLTPIPSAKTDMFALLSTVTLFLRRCHRRDYASPRRIWRRT
jgi:hypothetical protein